MRRLMKRFALLLYLAFLVFGLALAPRALGDLLYGSEISQARLTRERTGRRLLALHDRFRELSTEADELRLRVEKIRIAYGVAEDLEPAPVTEMEPVAFPASVYREEIEETVRLATLVRLQIGELEGKVAALRAFEASHPERVALTPSLSPLAGEFVLTSPFGYRRNAFTELEELHTGVDLAAPVGTAVVAPSDGEVVFAGHYSVRRRSGWWRLGRMVALRHGEDLLTLYGHCHRIRLPRGSRVERGAVIATVGETGVTVGPHLHYSVWRRNEIGAWEPADPRLFMLDRLWTDEEEILSTASRSPETWEYEALPRGLR